MPAVFRYLVRQGRGNTIGERLADEIVETKYKLGDLKARPVIRDELNNRYLVFESRPEFLEWYAEVPEAERCFHEVIFGQLPQRLKFDIDAPAHKLDAIPEATLAAALHHAGLALREGPQAPHAEIRAEELEEYIDDLLGVASDPLEEVLRSMDVPVAPPPARSPEDGRRAKAHAAVGLLLEAILDELYLGYYGVEDLYPTRKDLVVTDSTGATPDGVKYSYHVIILPYAVADNEEAREFTARVLERLPEPVRGLLDPDVNKRTQNFRLANSAKPGTKRYKKATEEIASAFETAEHVPLENLFITAAIGSRVLARVYTETGAGRGRRTGRAALEPQGGIVQAILELATREGAIAGHTLREVRGTLLCFDREVPTECRICGEVHHRDHTLMLALEPVEGGHEGAWPGTGAVACRVVEHCRHAAGRGRTLGELTLRAEELRGVERGGVGTRPGARSRRKEESQPFGLQELVADRVSTVREGRVNPHDASASEFEKLPDAQKTVYTEPSMREYELVPTLAVRAQMKMGKTKTLRQYLDAYFPADGLESKIVRFVTFRQTFSRSLAEAFPDFVLYSDVQGDLDQARHPRLIVQPESLHRMRMSARPDTVDLLILDEVESVLEQFNSGLHRHFTASFAVFQWMLRTARHVVCMDANLSDRAYRTLLRMRPAHPPHFHWNRFARASDDEYRFTADKGAWLERLYASVRAGKHVVLPTNSLSEGRAFEEALRREFPTKKIMLYSSETAPSEKARHFGDVHKYWSDLDVLIYTPTCSAGVSYELDHFDTLFGYFCDASCSVEICRQMLARVRNLRTREHNICLKALGAALPTTIDEIRKLIYNKRAGLYRRVEDAALHYEYTADGAVEYYESDYFFLWLETVRLSNLSRNNFARRFIDQVADTGARVTTLECSEPSAGAALLSSHREVQLDLREARCEAVASSPDLSPEEASHVREAFQAQQDVDPTQKLAYEKYQLRETYGWHGRPLDATFVAGYNSADARRVYRNLVDVTEGETLLDSLRLMRQREADHFDYVLETRSQALGHASECHDLLRDKTTYIFQAHFLAIWLLRICGFACLTDKARVHESAVEARVRRAIPALKRAVDQLVFEFGVPRPDLNRWAREEHQGRFLANALRTINAVLRTMYGLQVQRVSKRAGGCAYFLSQNVVGKLFVFALDPEPDGVQGGPRPHIPSCLRPVDNRHGRVNLFLEAAYYESVAPANVTSGPDAPADSPALPPDSPALPANPPMSASDPLMTASGSLTPPTDLSTLASGPPAYTLDDFLAEKFGEVTRRYGH